MISVVHIGLPLVPPWVPIGECEKIASRLIGIRQRMEAAGYRYEVMHASPESGLAELRKRLQSDPCDAVLIGGGVAADEKLAVFKQQIIDVTRDEAPGAKVLEFDHALDVQTLLERAFANSPE
jgi:molybdopterin biosynthesis enzyme